MTNLLAPSTGIATPDEVAAFLRTTPARLAKQRHFSTGPSYIKDGGRVLYLWEDVEAYVAQQKVTGSTP